jgi:hypothetical protein
MRGYLRLVLVLMLGQLGLRQGGRKGGGGRYNRRDLYQHWVKKEEPARRPCDHACCRGLRAHPENYPVARRNQYMKHASDETLASFFGRHGSESEKDQRIRDQVLAEMQRRDMRESRLEASRERRRERRSARSDFRRAERERLFVEAEAATNGYLLNRRGVEAGIDPRTLLTGPESRARKYASEELLDYWEDHPRPTEAYFEGRETRVASAGRNYSPRHRMTSEEAEWRDRYDRIGWDIEHPLAA